MARGLRRLKGPQGSRSACLPAAGALLPPLKTATAGCGLPSARFSRALSCSAGPDIEPSRDPDIWRDWPPRFPPRFFFPRLICLTLVSLYSYLNLFLEQLEFPGYVPPVLTNSVRVSDTDSPSRGSCACGNSI